MKEVFILGAGASHASAETPLGQDLVWTYFPDCFEFDISSNKRKFGPLLEFFKSKTKWKQYADKLCRCIKDRTICEFDVDKKYYIDELMKDLQREGNGQIINLIKRLTFEHIAETASEPKTKGLSLYEQFAQSLTEKSPSKISVISFNFDCLLHEEFKTSNVYKPVYFDYVIPFSSVEPGRKNYIQQNRIPLIKLHGSLDWVFNSETKQIHLRHWLIKPETHYLNNDEEPYIFLPYQQVDELIKPLRDQAKEELKKADTITIIGYSFPDCDEEEIIDLFQNVNPKAEWEVINYVEDSDLEKRNKIQDRYKKLFPNVKSVKFNFDGFENYICNEARSR